MIESYFHNQEGYNPFLIRDHWQVAQLNYLPKHGFEEIDQIEMHYHTDEVFLLVKGQAVLIAVNIEEEPFRFECQKMVPGVTYNIPAGTWHNIAMDKEAQIMIVERSYTHLHDCMYFNLTSEQTLFLKDLIHKQL